MADDEIVDPKKYFEERCKPKCVKYWVEYGLYVGCSAAVPVNISCVIFFYLRCVERVKVDETGHKHCTGQYFDYWSCVDQCVASKLFDKLK